MRSSSRLLSSFAWEGSVVFLGGMYKLIIVKILDGDRWILKERCSKLLAVGILIWSLAISVKRIEVCI